MDKQVLTFGIEISPMILFAILIGIPLLVSGLYWIAVIKVRKADRIVFAVLLDTSKSMTIDDCNGKLQRETVAERMIN